jgi:hypothetical protein
MAAVDELYIVLQESSNYSYSLLTRRYIDSNPYSFMISYETNLEYVKGFSVMQISLKGLKSGTVIPFKEKYERDIEVVYLGRDRFSEKRYGNIIIDLDELSYEDYEVTGRFQLLSNKGVIKEKDFSVILKTDYKKNYSISRFWDALMSV